MKKKIVSLLLIITLVSSNCLKIYAQEKETRSALALSGATATAILTLATYAGFQFKDSESCDEFLRRMIGMEQATEFIVEVTSLVGKSVDGTIKFSKQLVDDFKYMLNRIGLSKEIVYKTSSSGTSLPVVPWSFGQSSSKSLALIRMSPKTMWASNWNNTSAEKTFTYGKYNYLVSVKNYGYRASCVGDLSNPCMRSNGYGSTTPVEYGVAFLPVIFTLGGEERLGYLESTTYTDSTGLSYFSPTLYKCERHTLNSSDTSYQKQLNVQVGTGWETGQGSISSNDSEGGVTISIPSAMDSILGKDSVDVSTPSYDVWVPGKDVAIPEIQNPAIEYTPDKSTDVPGNDTTTGNPGFPNFGDIPKIDLDLTPLRNGLGKLTERFPFSLPWDLQRIAQSFGGQPNALAIGQAPVVNMNFNGHELVLDFAKFEPIAMILRGFIFTEVAIGLIFVLRKLKP